MLGLALSPPSTYTRCFGKPIPINNSRGVIDSRVLDFRREAGARANGFPGLCAILLSLCARLTVGQTLHYVKLGYVLPTSVILLPRTYITFTCKVAQQNSVYVAVTHTRNGVDQPTEYPIPVWPVTGKHLRDESSRKTFNQSWRSTNFR